MGTKAWVEKWVIVPVSESHIWTIQTTWVINSIYMGLVLRTYCSQTLCYNHFLKFYSFQFKFLILIFLLHFCLPIIHSKLHRYFNCLIFKFVSDLLKLLLLDPFMSRCNIYWLNLLFIALIEKYLTKKANL